MRIQVQHNHTKLFTDFLASRFVNYIKVKNKVNDATFKQLRFEVIELTIANIPLTSLLIGSGVFDFKKDLMVDCRLTGVRPIGLINLCRVRIGVTLADNGVRPFFLPVNKLKVALYQIKSNSSYHSFEFRID